MDQANALACMNCKKMTSEKDARVFAEVYVCSVCFTIAERTMQRLHGELNRLLRMSKEFIRIALLKGEMQLSESNTKDISKEDLLKMIVQMSENKNAPGSSGR